MGVSNLPKTVTRRRRDCDLNPGPSAPESSTPTTRLLGRVPAAGEGLVGRFVSILWSGAMSCRTPSSDDVVSARPARYFLDAARVSCGGEYDDDEVDVVRDIVLTLPVFLTLIVFSAFTSQVRESLADLGYFRGVG